MQNQRSVSRVFWLVIIGLLAAGLAGTWQSTAAQGSNLLQNPGFEGSYVPFAGDPTRLVAPGWSPWNIARKAGDPGFVNLTPEYRSAANARRIHGGSAAQELFTFFATHTGGVAQRVSVAPGSRLRFSVFVSVWSTSLDDPNASEQPGRVQVRVGIDPNGGTDGSNPNIIWSDQQEFYDQYRELSVEAVAVGNAVTVFVESAPKDPVKNNNTYVDDASLVVTGAELPPTSAPATNVPPTAVPPTAVAQQPSDTPNPFVPTREGTIVPVTPGGPTVTPFPTFNFPTPTPPGQVGQPTSSGPQPTVAPNLPGRIVYTVVAGDTVIELAQRFNSTVEAIISANGLDNSALIYVGQQLVIPVPTVQPTAIPPSPTFGTGGSVPPSGGKSPVDTAILNGPTVNGIGTYIVQPGDTFERIAARYNVTVQALAALNGIVNPQQVAIGQVLVVPGPGNNYPGGSVPPTVIPTVPAPPAARTHTVQAGENLFRISLRYGVTMDALMRANGIFNPNLIYVGQVLRIP